MNVNSVDLSIIILSYKSKDHLSVLLPSIFGSKTSFSFEVIVVDNDSRDKTAQFVKQQIDGLRITDPKTGDQFPILNSQLQLIENVNNGFAAGNNLGIKQSTGKYILLLNPDTKLEPDTLELMLKFMESRQDVGISGCKLIKANGKLDLACRRRFPNPWNSFERLFLKNNTNYNYSDISEDQDIEVDSVVGAFLLIRRSVMEKIGLLDEDFFMYGEDLDWCFRCKQAGFLVWYYPKAFAHHYKGESSKKAPFKMLKVFHDSMWIFYKKHYWEVYPLILHPLIWLGIYSRLVLLLFINIFKKNRVVSK